MKFSTPLIKLDSRVWSHAFEVPEDLQSEITSDHRRFKISINNCSPFAGAAMNGESGTWFFNVNQKRRDQLSIIEGDLLQVSLEKNTSEFGMDMPLEFQEMLLQDEEGSAYFNGLTPGKQRNLIYIVAQVKNPDIRIRRSLVVVTHLNINNGKIDFKALNQELKEANQAARNQ